MIRVPGEGRLSARLVVVGEAPGKHEQARGRPFVGPSGELLERWMREGGMHRADVRIENVVERKPPGNKIEAIDRAEMEWWIDGLQNRIAALDDPWVIVPTGNTALYALTGKREIKKYRGSIMEVVDRRGRRIKCIPTLHPAATFREPYLEKRCRRDWVRIGRDLGFRECRLPIREHYIRPTVPQVEEFYKHASRHAEVLSVDIETPGRQVGCVGFSYDPQWSLTVPTGPNYWGDNDTARYVWELITKLCGLPCPKVLQNGTYDTYWLERKHGIEVVNYVYDLMWMHHTEDPLEDHDLAFQASVDTREPYWKDEGKDADDDGGMPADIEEYWRYNGKDAAVQRELFDVRWARLRDRGLVEVYWKTKARLIQPTHRMMCHGVRVDRQRARRAVGRLTVERIAVEDRLAALCGRPLHAKKGLSNPRIKTWLKEQGVKIPRVRNPKGKWVETVDEGALRKMAKKYARVREAVGVMLQHRRIGKLAGALADRNFDEDDRMRSRYTPTADNGRFQSKKNPMGTGTNAQNQDRELREMYVPDPGCVFVELDTSQGEWRILCMLSGDAELMELARLSPDQFDIHSFNAGIIFGLDPCEVNKGQRYLAKRIVHGTDYGMQDETMAESFLTDKTAVKMGLQPTPSQCGRWRAAYLERFPAVPRWQAGIRAQALQARKIVNSWGLEYLLGMQRMSDELFRQCYAFACASELAGLVNEAFIQVDEWIQGEGLRSRINVHNHDALLLSCPPEEAYDVCAFTDRALGTPHAYAGRVLAMPNEVKVGMTWKGDREWKCVPGREEFEAAIHRLALAA